ncbi:MAG: hypothetical protein ACRDQ9_14120 [Pseudonocardiaceae bacterium]
MSASVLLGLVLLIVGLLGHQVAATMSPPTGGCTCRGGRCTVN